MLIPSHFIRLFKPLLSTEFIEDSICHRHVLNRVVNKSPSSTTQNRSHFRTHVTSKKQTNKTRKLSLIKCEHWLYSLKVPRIRYKFNIKRTNFRKPSFVMKN